MEGDRMEKVNQRGILSGLGNLVSMEAGRLINTHQWLTTSLIYLFTFQLFIISSLLSSNYKVNPHIGIDLLIQLVPLFVPITVVALLQNEVIKEKELGTMAWVLTSPVNRSTFIVAKFLVNILWALTISVVIEFASCWFLFPILNQNLPPLEMYLATICVNMLNALFFITLTIMLGCFLQSRGPVIGIPMITLLAQYWFEGELLRSGLVNLFPISLTYITRAWLSSSHSDFLIPAVAVSAWSIIFVAASIWRVRREQF
jgi:ABC-2 type transport system permease protein